jgi:transposase
MDGLLHAIDQVTDVSQYDTSTTTKNQCISNNLRALIIKNINNGHSVMEMSRILNIKQSTISKIKKVYETTGRKDKLSRGGSLNSKKVYQEHAMQIIAWIEEDCTLTLKEIQVKIKTKFDLDISTTTITRVLSGFRFSLKRVSLHPERRNCETTINTRRAYAETFVDLIADREKIIFIDETGFSISMRRFYGRSPKGQRASVTVKSIRTRNYSLVASMTVNGIFYFSCQNIPFNSEHFNAYVVELLTYISRLNMSNCHLVVDNVSFHKNEELKRLILVHGHSLHFLPPYSPFLNPIENLFSQWKSGVRASRPNNEIELVNAINQAETQITADHCRGYFRNMERYIPLCRRGEAITE